MTADMARLVPHFLTARGTLDAHAPAIHAAIARLDAGLAIDLPPVDIVVRDDADRTLPGGIGGYCGRPREVWLDIDAARRDLTFHAGGAFDRILVHELHHALRWEGPGYGTTLGEALVSEGLAGHFVAETCGTAPEPWETAFDDATLAEAWAEARAGWSDDGYDHADWFFGAGRRPRWLGYSLGHALVDAYLRAHPGATAATLADRPASVFRATVL